MYIKPSPGLNVPDPDHGGVLPAEGRDVPPHQYWLRRIEAGDVFEADPPVDPVPAAAKKTKSP